MSDRVPATYPPRTPMAFDSVPTWMSTRPCNPISVRAWRARGSAFLMLARYDEALADLKQAQNLEPANAEVQQLVAQAQGKVNEIVQNQRAKEAVPETGTVRLPDTAESAPKPEAKPEVKPEAKPAAPAVMPDAPPPPAPAPAAAPVKRAADYSSAGRILLSENRFAEAIAQFSEALKLDPSLPLVYNARGYARFRLKQYSGAIADFDQAIRLNPAYTNAYLNRGAARAAAGDKAGADADNAKARELTAKTAK